MKKIVVPIPDIGRAWKFGSVQVASAAAIFGALPAEQQQALLDLVGLGPERLPLVLGLLFILARVLQRAES